MTSQQYAVAPAPVVVREPSVFARSPAIVVRWAWRARWQLAPLVFGAVVFFVGTGAPAVTGTALTVISATAVGVARFRPEGRMFLSPRERRILGAWSAAAALWAVSVSVWPIEPTPSALALAAAVAAPSALWATSRRVRRDKLNRDARALIEAWDDVAHRGPDKLRGSAVVPGTVTVLDGTAVVFTVRLAHGVNSATITEGDRQGAEACYDLPGGTLTLGTLREKVTLIRVAISPARHMEGTDGVPYDGPVIDNDGRVPLAVTPRGEHVGTRMGTPIGVMHTLVLGATGYGKSTTVNALLLPSVLTRRAIYLFMDGSHGTSLRKSGMTPFMTEKALDRARWKAFIRAAYAILVARELADAIEDPGDRPEIYLIAEEAPAIGPEISEYEHELCRRITAKGRKVGVGLIQIAQGANAEDILGGVKARGNSTQIIAHRPLDGNAMRKALETVPGADRIDLMRLPEEPGWVAVIDRGQVWPQARVKYVTPEQIAGYARGFEPMQLSGPDMEAARPFLYPDDEPVADDDEPDEPGARERLLNLIRAHERVTLGLLAPKDGTRPHTACDVDRCPAWALGRRQTVTHLNALLSEGALAKEGTSWLIAE